MEIKRSDNLCNFYILPLLGLNKLSFGSGNFINSYVSKDDKYIVVEVKEPKTSFQDHDGYVTDFIAEGKVTIIFSIPEGSEDTLSKFKAGKYSEFTEQVKQVIRTKSGLKWKVPSGNKKTLTAREILALDKDSDLREKMEDELGVKIPKNAELMSVPHESNFYDLSLSTISS